MKPDGLVFARLGHMEPRFFKSASDPGHMGGAPGDNDIIRVRKTSMDFFEQMPIAFEEKVVEKLLLKIRRRRILQYFKDILRIHSSGMDEHDQIEEINRILRELFNIHVRPHKV